jgi:hypothetical protein
MHSFPQVFVPKPCMHLSYPPTTLQLLCYQQSTSLVDARRTIMELNTMKWKMSLLSIFMHTGNISLVIQAMARDTLKLDKQLNSVPSPGSASYIMLQCNSYLLTFNTQRLVYILPS